MLFLMNIIYAIISLTGIILTCSLFTNAIEHLGDRLKLGNNAIGSILAVIGTTLPETIVPLVALAGGYLFNIGLSDSQNIAIGAIIGSPFILSTFALFLLGIILLIKKRNELDVDYKNVLRDYKYFIPVYILAIGASFIDLKLFKFLVVMVLVGFYTTFVLRTIKKSKENFQEQKLDELVFYKLFKKNFIFLQVLISLAGLIFFSHVFINEIKYFSYCLNINPLILSLFIAPIATELPECVNSIIWLKDNKDDLAFANILGAVIFQSVIPMSIGILLTPWLLNKTILINVMLVLICSLTFSLTVVINKKIKLSSLLFCGVFYFLYLAYIIIGHRPFSN